LLALFDIPHSKRFAKPNEMLDKSSSLNDLL
jgi:hypothetical protein